MCSIGVTQKSTDDQSAPEGAAGTGGRRQRGQKAGEAITMTTSPRPQLLSEDYFPKTFSTSPTFF